MTQHPRRRRRPQASASRYRRVPSVSSFGRGQRHRCRARSSKMTLRSTRATSTSLHPTAPGCTGNRPAPPHPWLLSAMAPKGKGSTQPEISTTTQADGRPWHDDRLPAARLVRDAFGNPPAQDMANGRATRITDLEQPVDDVDGWWYLAPTFSPDGQNVIFQWPQAASVGTKWDLWSVPVTGGRAHAARQERRAGHHLRPSPPTRSRPAEPPPFSTVPSLVIAEPDGFRAYSSKVSSAGIFEPKMSPDGSRIAYQGRRLDFCVVDVAIGEASTARRGTHGRVGRRRRHAHRGPRR